MNAMNKRNTSTGSYAWNLNKRDYILSTSMWPHRASNVNRVCVYLLIAPPLNPIMISNGNNYTPATNTRCNGVRWMREKIKQLSVSKSLSFFKIHKISANPARARVCVCNWNDVNETVSSWHFQLLRSNRADSGSKRIRAERFRLMRMKNKNLELYMIFYYRPLNEDWSILYHRNGILANRTQWIGTECRPPQIAAMKATQRYMNSIESRISPISA